MENTHNIGFNLIIPNINIQFFHRNQDIGVIYFLCIPNDDLLYMIQVYLSIVSIIIRVDYVLKDILHGDSLWVYTMCTFHTKHVNM